MSSCQEFCSNGIFADGDNDEMVLQSAMGGEGAGGSVSCMGYFSSINFVFDITRYGLRQIQY
jgi:hypothetical protein